MLLFDLQTTQYSVSKVEGFSLSDALRHWKAKFETFDHFKREVIRHPALEKMGKFVEEMWSVIQPITVQDALQEQNLEKRRVIFDCLGVARLFRELQPKILDKQVLKKARNRWDINNQPYLYQFDDTYELYQIDGHKLFKQVNEWTQPNPVFAVRCWCTSTKREYWIYVPEQVALGLSADSTPDAIRAIAWTIQVNISKPKRLFRQGDIIIAEESVDSEEVPPYHLSKQQYINLMFSET